MELIIYVLGFCVSLLIAASAVFYATHWKEHKKFLTVQDEWKVVNTLTSIRSEVIVLIGDTVVATAYLVGTGHSYSKNAALNLMLLSDNMIYVDDFEWFYDNCVVLIDGVEYK